MPIVKISKCRNCDIPHEWLFESFTLKELRIMKKLTRLTQKTWAEAGAEEDPEAVAILLYLLHERDHIKIPFDDVDLDFADYEMIPTDEEQKRMDEAEEAKAGPKDENKSESGPTNEAG